MMKSTVSLALKEWREARIYLWIGLGIFLGLPVIGAVEYSVGHPHRFEIETVPWVGYLGGVLAVLVAVGGTCRDLSGGLEDFLRSLPVSAGRWIWMKFLVGLAIVILACAVPILAESAVNRTTEPLVLGSFLCFFFLTVYSLAFAAGCLFRRTAHAAMVGIGAMLMVALVPLIFPPLHWLSIMDLDGTTLSNLLTWRSMFYVDGMVALAGVGIGLALAAVRRGWRIVVGRRLIYGAIAVALLILCATASFQMGTNLPILQRIDIPGSDFIGALRVDGNSGEVQSRHYISYRDPNTYEQHDRSSTSFYKIEVTSDGVKLGSSFETDDWLWTEEPKNAILPDGSVVRYALGSDDGEWDQTRVGPLRLTVHHFTGEGKFVSSDVAPVELWSLDQVKDKYANFLVWKDRLYVFGYTLDSDGGTDTRLGVLDIADPLKPRVLSNGPFHYRFGRSLVNWVVDYPRPHVDDALSIDLPQVPGLPARQRIKLALGGVSSVVEGDTCCFEQGEGITEYRITDLTEQAMKLVKVGEFKPSILQEVFGEYALGRLQLQNGLLYEMDQNGMGFLRPRISVFETRGQHPMRLIAHFAAPGAHAIQLLPDGRALVAGSKLWLVGAPKREN